MKALTATMLVLSMASTAALAQVRGTDANSAEALSRIAAQRAKLAPAAVGELTVTGLKKGAKGRPERIDAKVMQVIDEGQMLVGIEDARTGGGRFSTWIMLKCPTDEIVDGKHWRGGQWKAVTGSDVLEVLGTTTYKTAGGSTKTVFVVGPVVASKPEAQEKPTDKGTMIRGARDFVGRWRIVDDKGVTSCYFTLSASAAKKSHAPKVTAKWELVGKEARITWSDGWKDILRPQKDGVLKIAFGPGTSWDDKPANTQHAIKEPQK
jgi:hypothetical protein